MVDGNYENNLTTNLQKHVTPAITLDHSIGLFFGQTCRGRGLQDKSDNDDSNMDTKGTGGDDLLKVSTL